MSGHPSFGWWQVLRLALVQACLGSVVVITTSTLNRIMVVELMMPALLPGLLVGLHYAVQMVRPRMGFGADQGRRCTPWMVGGMAVLSLGGCLAAQATVTMGSDRGLGVALAALAFAMIGVGVSACGTSLLVLLAKRVDDDRRAPAATLVWVMMIVGFAVTAVVVGKHLDPYTPERMLSVVCTAAALSWFIACACLGGFEGPAVPAAERGGAQAADTAVAHPAAQVSGDPLSPVQGAASVRFRQALAQVWDEPAARKFTVFVFLSMLAYSSQDLILEPFAGRPPSCLACSMAASCWACCVSRWRAAAGRAGVGVRYKHGWWAGAWPRPWPWPAYRWPQVWVGHGPCWPMCSCWGWPMGRFRSLPSPP